jgi:hypothetical protein
MRKTMIRGLLLLFMMLAFSAASRAQVGISVGFGPPALLAYEQPICPGDGYIWTPGYWAWDADAGGNYYWVDGSWELAPEVGFLWTPGYWGWGGGGFMFNEGYWGPQVGFYGGINYGFGYGGEGYYGGRWDNGHFFYNRSVSNVNIEVNRNVYNEHVTVSNESRVSFNGGTGGITTRPNPREEAASHERHIAPVAAQTQHEQTARSNPASRAPANHNEQPAAEGRTSPAAEEHNAKPANAGEANARPEATASPRTPVHPSDLAPIGHPAAPNTGNPKLDQKYQKQQESMVAKQTQERQKLQKQQDNEHQQQTQHKANDAAKQQLEQKHTQQTQQMADRHTQQQQAMQTRQQPAHQSAPAPKPH